MSDDILIRLSKAKALLLYEGLLKLEELDLPGAILSAGEVDAFWTVEAALDKALPVFASDYAAQVAAAENEVQARSMTPPTSPRLVLIAAISRNRVLAADGKIPWRMPRDTAHFRARSAGHWLLLGRRTFEQMRDWFRPDQVPLVLTRETPLAVPGGHARTSLEDAIQLARSQGVAELLVCGGGSVYQATLPLAHEVILTTVEAEFEGDVFFPELPLEEWRIQTETHFPPDGNNPHAMRITHWIKEVKGTEVPETHGKALHHFRIP